MTSPKPERAAQKPGRAARGQQGFGSLTVVVLCAACFFAGRFITLPGQLPPAAGSGVSAGQNPAANAASCRRRALRISVFGVQWGVQAGITVTPCVQPTVVDEPKAPASPSERRSALETDGGSAPVAQQRAPLSGVRMVGDRAMLSTART